MNRQKQLLINNRIAFYLKYKPFIFNSSRGMYIFTKKNESFNDIEDILIQVFSESDLSNIRIFDTSLSQDFFRSVTKEVLQSGEISAFAWKRFISSFLIQADPYGAKSEPDNIIVFQNFKAAIRNNGNRVQKRYFKRKMKILRKRVSLDSLNDLL
ncbi:hypothetical protein [Lutimonas sp.]|uniref:hypothetical protein n=1 Tax=Lutimonas sp. TaxID=1872403 RepID=UPI003D9BDF2D